MSFFLPGSLLSFLQMLSWASAAGSLTNVGKSANLSWLLAVQGQRRWYMAGGAVSSFQYGSWFFLACLGIVGNCRVSWSSKSCQPHSTFILCYDRRDLWKGTFCVVPLIPHPPSDKLLFFQLVGFSFLIRSEVHGTKTLSPSVSNPRSLSPGSSPPRWPECLPLFKSLPYILRGLPNKTEKPSG